MKNNIILSLLVFFILSCDKKTKYESDTKYDSLTLIKKYEDNYYKNIDKVSEIHNELNKIEDSSLIGLNHQFYSDYLLRNNKLDSAYYYLKLADKSFKFDTEKLFFNSLKKIYLTNRAKLFLHSEIEIEKTKKNIAIVNKSKKLYLDIFEIPVLEQKDSLLYNQALKKFNNLSKQDSLIVNNNNFIENYLDAQRYKYLIKHKKFSNLRDKTSKKIDFLINNNRLKEDLFFTNLYYCIVANQKLNDDIIHYYFWLYEQNTYNALTSETEILLHNLKYEYFLNLGNIDSANYYLLKNYNLSKESNNTHFITASLKRLAISPNIDNKYYMKEYIIYNDSVFNYSNKLDDYIFYLNSNNDNLLNEKNNIQRKIKNNILISIIILTIITISLIGLRNKFLSKLIANQNYYLKSKSKIFSYLLHIKNKLDLSNENEKNKIKNLIQNNAIYKIDYIINNIQNKNFESNVITNELLELEQDIREISHTIAKDKNKTIDIVVILEDLKEKFCDFFKIEYFVENNITINETGFKEFLRTVLFTGIYFEKIMYKNNLTCFVSVYRSKELKKIIYKVWINMPLKIDKNIFIFLDDRKLPYKTYEDEDGQTIEIYL